MIRVAIADDHAIVRRGIAQILSAEADLAVVGEAANHGEVMELVRKGGIDCLLLDIAMPGRNGIDTLKQVKSEFPPLAVLMISNVCYLAFNFLNLQAGWIHRIDRGDKDRPFRCPTWLLALGCTFGFVNMAFMGAGADVWGPGTLRNGLIALLLIVPVFAWRHYVQDKGVFPHALVEDYARDASGRMTRRAGWLPWLALAGCAALIAVTHAFALHHMG